MKLIGVARASLEELLLDYQDLPRQRAFKPITEKVAKFCWDNKKKFGGRAYCFDCQKKF